MYSTLVCFRKKMRGTLEVSKRKGEEKIKEEKINSTNSNNVPTDYEIIVFCSFGSVLIAKITNTVKILRVYRKEISEKKILCWCEKLEIRN